MKNPLANPRCQRLFGLIGCAVLLACFGITAWRASLGESATYDEPLHLVSAWVQTHEGDFRDNPEDPPLWKYYVAIGTDNSSMTIDRQDKDWPKMLQTMAIDNTFSLKTLYTMPRTVDNEADRIIAAARFRMALLGILLGATIAGWAWRLGGPLAGVIAAAAFCLDPNFLAHSPLVKNDVPITLALLVTAASVWLLGERATLFRFIAMSILLGAAITTKFSGVLAFPMIALLLICRALSSQPWFVLRWSLMSRLGRVAAAALMCIGAGLISYVFIWAVYGFRFSPSPDPSEVFNFYDTYRLTAANETLRAHGAPPYVTPDVLGQWMQQWHPGIQTRLNNWANQNHLLPQAFLNGFQYTYAESLVRATYLCREINLLGWWYYFPLVFIFKTPLATMIALPLAMAAAWRLRKAQTSNLKPQTPEMWPFLATFIPPALYLSFAMTNHLNLGVRHVLPIYPYLFIFLGVVAAKAIAAGPRIAVPLVAALLIGLATETYFAYPNFISFFNAPASAYGNGGIDLLSDSNIDWGQELPQLANWQKQHPDRQLYLSYFGTVDPRFYGIQYINLPGSMAPEDQTRPANLKPVFAFSVTNLQGVNIPRGQLDAYARFRSRRPTWNLGGSMYLYDGP